MDEVDELNEDDLAEIAAEWESLDEDEDEDGDE
jgi:hypothetical protein